MFDWVRKTVRDVAGKSAMPAVPGLDTDFHSVASSRLTASPQFAPATALSVQGLSIYYGGHLAVRDISLEIPQNRVTAFIGPSGCGKSSVLRCFNRMNDIISGARVKGQLYLNTGRETEDIGRMDPVALRRRVGMVFQQPNPFPKSIYENIAWGAGINRYRGEMDELVENALRRAALWDEVKDKLQKSGLSLSGGQQQRLCIARAIAIQPEVILMDEPCSALDPISTLQIENLLDELKEQYTIVIVTHNMQQASRKSDKTAFFNTARPEEGKFGYLVEYGDTEQIFSDPKKDSTRDYVSGRFG